MAFVVSALLALVATPVFAKQVRLFAGTFGASASVPANPYPLVSPEHVAVDDSTHDVYVADPDGARVEKFNDKGEFLLMFGKAVNKTKVKEAGSTEAEQNLCTLTSGDECGVGESQPTPVGRPGFVAVDNSSGESKGDVYVSTREFSPTGLIEKFDSSGHLVSGWATGGQLDGSTVKKPPAPVEGPFGEIHGIAVDASGNLWVQSNDTFEFRQDASFITGGRFADGEFSLDPGDNLYSFEGGGIVDKLDSAGNLLGLVAFTEKGVIAGSLKAPFRGVVVDPFTNNLFLGFSEDGTQGHYSIQRYDSSCHPTITTEGLLGPPCVSAEQFGANILHFFTGLALDPAIPTDALYVAEPGGGESGRVAVFSIETVPDVSATTPSSLTSTSATLQGIVGPSGVALSECFFDWGETTAYGNKAQCEAPSAAEIPVDSNSHAVHAVIAGLQAGKTYHYRLVAGNANDVNALIDEPSRSQDFAFGLPSIEDESVLDVTASSATLQTLVNPNDIDTVFHIEYGTQAGVYGELTPETDVGSGGSGQDLLVHLQSLLPGTVYHYRVVATNSLGTSESQDETFTTQAAGVFSLLDGRAWELVSPADKHGALIRGLVNDTVVQASVDGGAVTYLASAPTETQPSGNSNMTQVLSTRGGVGASWGSRDISTPRDVANGVNTVGGEEDGFFSSDLSLAVVQPRGVFVPSLSSEASEQTPYLRTNYTGRDRLDPCVSSCYRPLVTGAQGFANVPEGTEFGEPSQCRTTNCGPRFLGASPDGAHVVLTANAALAEGAPAGSMYEWANGQLQLVSVLPEEQPAPTSSSPRLGTNRGVVGGAVSVDGSRIVWSAGGGSERLYVRDMTLEETVELGGVEARFQGASKDGSRDYFTVKGELFMFEAPLGGPLSAGHSTDLTPGGGVMGTALGVSGDGSVVYFVATTVLSNTPSARGEEAQSGQPNLYVYRAGTVELVAVLSGEDAPDWGSAGFGLMTTARVSPDGRWLAFMSNRSLTGYDNRDSTSGVRDEEVFHYEAAGGGSPGTLACASCNPTGARPHGLPDVVGEKDTSLVDKQKAWAGAGGSELWLAANIPSWVSSLYQSRYLSDGGRLFFNSNDALVPSDTNGTEDVYEYEPPGVGSCTSESTSFGARSNGCVDLVSSGVSKEESAFLDASENGDDAFFLTSAQLSSQDKDTSLDVYDARVGGGSSESQAPPACEGDACQSPVAAPNDPTPGSLTYRGPGNPEPLFTVRKTTRKTLVKCAKNRKVIHGKCVKRRKKARKAASIRRAGNRRGVRS